MNSARTQPVIVPIKWLTWAILLVRQGPPFESNRGKRSPNLIKTQSAGVPIKWLNWAILLARHQLPLLLLLLFSTWLAAAAHAAESHAADSSVTLHHFKLVGDLANDGAAFTLTATALVEN